jgi:hypothetical protein
MISNKWPTATSQTPRKTKTSKTQNNWKEKKNKNLAKINEKETKKKKLQRINEIKIWFFEKISTTDKPLSNLTKMRKEKTQISKIRNKKKGR